MIRITKHFIPSAILAILGIVSFPGISSAQGSRKDDIVFNAQGRPMAGATVRVCASSATGQPCSPLASIYSDAGLTQALANPLSSDGLGNYTFYAAPGRYEIEISGPGITTKQLPNVILPSDPSSPTFTTVTTTSGISAFSLALTGNLTVSGSTSVAGTLSVGGAPVPSANADNQWTAGQRFKGAIPWRDFTAYMPPGGCSSTNTSDPNTTGTISNGSSTLLLLGAIDFKNGCGITVLGAGPTSTLVMPSGCTASVSQSSGTVTATCSTNHNLAVGYNTGGQDESVVVSGCSDGGFNGTFGIQSVGSNTTLTWSSAHTGSATGCTLSFLNGWIHGASGSKTYYYKFAACDSGSGCSAAVGPVTITSSAMVVQSSPNYRAAYSSGTTYAINDEVSYINELWLSLANSNLGNEPDLNPSDWVLLNENYNWVGWPIINNSGGIAKLVCIYRSTDNVTYSAIGTSSTMGYADRGLPFPVFPACCSTPSATPTARQLTTTIASGAGTTSLILASAASNNASSQNVYHDETPFLTSCLTDVKADQAQTIATGSHGCLIPSGSYQFNSDWPTDSTLSSGLGLAISVDGTIVLRSWPIIMSGNSWTVQGMGFSGSSSPGAHFPTTNIVTGAHVPDAFILQGYTLSVHGFALNSLYGNGINMSESVGNGFAQSGIDIKDLAFTSSVANSGGVPIVVDANTLFVTGENLDFEPSITGIPASILFTSTNFNGNTWCCMEFKNIFTVWHGIQFEAPGGVNTGEGAPISFTHWESEERGQYPTGGFVTLDEGVTGQTPGTSPAPNLPHIGITQLDDADSTNEKMMYYKGVGFSTLATIFLRNSDLFKPLVSCAFNSTVCANGADPIIQADSPQNLTGVQDQYVGPGGTDNRTYYILRPLVTSEGYLDAGATPPRPAWADALPPARQISISSTGSGSLAAAQYCMEIVFLDTQSTPGYTLPSPEICQSVGASSDIVVAWATSVSGLVYKDVYLLYGPTPGGENMAIDTGITPSGFSGTYTFTSTGTAISFTVPSTPTAYMSWLYRDPNKPSCLYCVVSSSNTWPLGIGEPSVPSGDKLAVKGGVLDAESGFKSTLATKSANYTLTTSDYWVNVTGTTTITVPHANVGNHWVVFNSGSNTVTVQADSGNINGAATISLSANTGKEIACDGTNCFAH